MPLLLVRHARAGDRRTWEGDDRDRPLDGKGVGQAEQLIELLAAFAIEAVYTSPYRRLQTVEPLARARSLAVHEREELGEEEQFSLGAELVRSLAGRNVIVCGHGGLEAVVLDDPPTRWRKGETLVLDPDLQVQDSLR